MSRSMTDSAVHFFLEQNRNCAESILLAADAGLGLGLSPAALRAVGAFGGGLGCGETCGALCGAVAALGLLLIDERGAHSCPDAKRAAADMSALFIRTFGSLRCAELKPRFATEEQRCAELVARTATLLEGFCAGLDRPG